MRNWVLRAVAAIHASLYRLSGGRLGGKIGKAPVLLLTTVGRKSGKPRTHPLLYTRAGDAYAVIASKSGSPTHPLWCQNLKANRSPRSLSGRRHTRCVPATQKVTSATGSGAPSPTSTPPTTSSRRRRPGASQSSYSNPPTSPANTATRPTATSTRYPRRASRASTARTPGPRTTSP